MLLIPCTPFLREWGCTKVGGRIMFYSTCSHLTAANAICRASQSSSKACFDDWLPQVNKALSWNELCPSDFQLREHLFILDMVLAGEPQFLVMEFLSMTSISSCLWSVPSHDWMHHGIVMMASTTAATKSARSAAPSLADPLFCGITLHSSEQLSFTCLVNTLLSLKIHTRHAEEFLFPIRLKKQAV